MTVGLEPCALLPYGIAGAVIDRPPCCAYARPVGDVAPAGLQITGFASGDHGRIVHGTAVDMFGGVVAEVCVRPPRDSNNAPSPDGLGPLDVRLPTGPFEFAA